MGLVGTSAVALDADLTPLLAKIQQAKQQIASIQAAVGASVPAAGGAAAPLKLPTDDIRATEQAVLRYGSSLAAVQKAQHDLSGAADTWRTVLAQLTPNTIEANRATAALAQTEAQIAREAAGGGSALGELGGQLGAMVGPAALATAAIGAVVAAGHAVADAFQFAAQLKEEQDAFGGLIGSAERGNAVLEQATARGKAFGFTQKEITDAFKELAPVIRDSTSSTQAQTEALARISTLRPEAPVQALSAAIEGINAGRFTELRKELGLSGPEAKALAQSVAEGKDAFDALNEALDRHGATLEVARQRTEGVIGAERQLKQAQEDNTLAMAKFAQGPGLAVLKEYTQAVTGLTRVLGGDGGLTTGWASAGQALNQYTGASNVFGQSLGLVTSRLNVSSDALARDNAARDQAVAAIGRASAASLDSGTAYDAEGAAVDRAKAAHDKVIQTLIDSIQEHQHATAESTKLAGIEKTLAGLGEDVAKGFLTAGSAAVILANKYGYARDQALALVDAQAELAHEQIAAAKVQQDVSGDAILQTIQRTADAADRAAKVTKDHQEAQLLLARAHGDTATEIGVLRAQQQGLSTDSLEYARIQGQIASAQKTADSQAKALLTSENELALARAHTPEARVAVLQKELAATTDLTERNRILARIEQERSARAAGGGGAGSQKGLTALERSDIALNASYIDQLAEVNHLLAQRGLNQTQYNELLIKQRDLQRQIQEASLGAAAAEIEDRQKTRVENQEIATAERIIASGRASSLFKAAAEDRLQLIQIERAQRQLEIARKVQEAGGVPPRVGATPVPLAQPTPTGLAAPAGAPLGPRPQPFAAPPLAAPALPSIEFLPGSITVTIDGREIESRIINNARLAFQRSKASGAGVSP